MKQGQRTGAQRGTSEHRSDWPFLHAITPNGAKLDCAVAVPFVLPQHDTRSVRVGERHCPPACLRRLQAVERNGATAADARASAFFFSRSGVAAKRSGVKRIETPESGIVRGGSLRINRRRHRRTGASRTSHPSIVAGAIDSQSADAFNGPRFAAGVAPYTRRLECLSVKRGRRILRRHRRARMSIVAAAEFAVLAQRFLACLGDGMCRNETQRPRRCEPHRRAAERVAQCSEGIFQRRSQASSVKAKSRDGARCRGTPSGSEGERTLAGLGWPIETHSAVCGGWPV